MYHDTRLLDGQQNLKELVTRLKQPWKTMHRDMDTAFCIIGQCIKTEAKFESRKLISLNKKREWQLNFPNWQNELEKTLIHQYGLNHGKLILNKVLMRLFEMSRGTEVALH